MNNFFVMMKKFSKEIATYALYVAAAFCLLYHVGNFGEAFLPVMGNLVLLLVEVALWGLLPILLSIGKHSVAKGAYRPIFAFWLLSTIFAYLEECTLIGKGSGGVATSMGVFELLIACAFVVIAVFSVLALAQEKPEWKKVVFFVFLGCLFLYLIVFSLRIALFAKAKMPWNSYFEVLYKYFVLPFAMFFLTIHFEFSLDEMRGMIKETSHAEKPSEAPAPAVEETPVPAVEEVSEEEESPAEAPSEEGELAATDAAEPETPKTPPAERPKRGRKKKE